MAVSRLCGVLLLTLLATGCGLFRHRPESYPPLATESGLVIQDLHRSQGEEARAGDQVWIHYEGWLEDGAKFDSSVDRARPITFLLGAGEVPPGLDEGVVGMRVLSTRRLLVPPDLGYGEDGVEGVIPGGATLIFELELLAIGTDPPAP